MNRSPFKLSDASKRTAVTGIRSPAADPQTIRPDAQLLFVTGAGWTKKQADGQTHVPEAEKLILGFLNLPSASLGSSKSLVDPAAKARRCCHSCRISIRSARPVQRRGTQRGCPPVVTVGTACRGLAFHRRAQGHEPRPELRLGARQSRRVVRGGRVQSDGEGK